MNQTQQQNPNQSQEGKDETMAEKYRKYSENVDFEELDGPMEDTPDTNPGTEQSTRYQEEAISDAEFEEIP